MSRAQASDWFALRRSGAMDEAARAAFDAWLAEPDNARAFAEVEATWALLDAARDDPAMLAMREAAERAHRPVRRRWIAGGAVAAGLAAVALALPIATSPQVIARLPLPAERTLSTGAGQMTTMTLPDGTQVTLDSDTVLKLHDTPGQRLVTMERGRAFFRVAKDSARPFSLIANGKKVTAVGTAFDVNLANDCFELVLVEGKVRVADAAVFRRPQSADLAPGSRLIVAKEGRWAVTRVNVEKETGWLRGWLTYDRAPMGQIAADLNQYSEKQIVIADAAVAATPMMGAFKPGDVEGFVRAARYYNYATVSETADQVVLTAPAEK
ncbi:MAG TPA: FecR domain-containing protein [Caulobacteraceae bacterium]